MNDELENQSTSSLDQLSPKISSHKSNNNKSSVAYRRMSENDEYVDLKSTMLSDAPNTPRSRHVKVFQAAMVDRNSSGNSNSTTYASNLDDAKLKLKRANSDSTMAGLELNRTAPLNKPSFDPTTKSELNLKKQPGVLIKINTLDDNMLQGFVTCLNSRNVQKYKLGQKYRDGKIVGIDDTNGKIIVYNEKLPRGSLTILKTQNAHRYEKGYSLEDVKGNLLGIVHAIDHVANIIVLNTAVNAQ